MDRYPDASTGILRAVPKAPRPEKPDVVKTTVELPAELWREAKIRAMDERVDLRTVFIRALEKYLDLGAKPITRRDRGPR
jgi:hypothetical protein